MYYFLRVIGLYNYIHINKLRRSIYSPCFQLTPQSTEIFSQASVIHKTKKNLVMITRTFKPIQQNCMANIKQKIQFLMAVNFLPLFILPGRHQWTDIELRHH